MSEYVAPLKDIRFVMQELAGLDQVVALPGCEEASPDVVDAILEEAAKFAGEVLSPLNRVGDTNGAKWKDMVVTSSPGFKEAYHQFVDNGWNGLGCEPEFGGQGLPKVVSTAVSEMWKASNHAFSLCPMLTQGAIEALTIAGSDEQKAAYLPNLISGEWTGTMNLTEPSAGSDLAAVRSRAEPVGDGTYKIFGQKIFITWGEHDMTDNIVHLVLARTPNAPEGVKGISLFVVPKFMLNADDVRIERIEVVRGRQVGVGIVLRDLVTYFLRVSVPRPRIVHRDSGETGVGRYLAQRVVQIGGESRDAAASRREIADQRDVANRRRQSIAVHLTLHSGRLRDSCCRSHFLLRRRRAWRSTGRRFAAVVAVAEASLGRPVEPVGAPPEHAPAGSPARRHLWQR